MADENELKDEAETGLKDEAQTGAEEKPAAGGRMDSAKAFFRAMYAGSDEELPEVKLTGQDEEPAASGPCRNCQALAFQVGELESKYGEMEALYKRMMADFENYRRRMEREKEEFQGFGIQRTVESLLPALDDMDRAVSALNKDMAAEKILESVRLVFGRLTQCLGQLGVKTMTVVGEQFDPRFHEPVQEIESTDVPDGHVLHELRRGYVLNDRVIRPALVNVAANSGTAGSGHNEAPALAEETEPEKVYDLSGVDDSEAAEKQLTKSLDEYLETP